ncbi:hypothetical protein D9619_009039 [Psilocybe cf. subviscida]|uniref:Uncharacterized protein n=1 Tax=Psilocybe cf. subviscida TaxID=2480587 RepID=A0A8H5BTW2_9AGAR|nr:hypothetical protein D9619_009039 [Psilocybe cf. subviscida]
MSQPKAAVKKNAYLKRSSTSIAAPLELDSDSDFNPGVYVPPKPTKKKGRASAAASLKKRKQKSVSASEAEDEFGLAVKRVKYEYAEERKVHRKVPNVLMEYFEKDLNLHSESEDDADEEDNEDEDEDSSEEKEERPFVTKTMDIYKTFAKKPLTAESSAAGSSQGPSNKVTPDRDCSTTESDNSSGTASDTDADLPIDWSKLKAAVSMNSSQISAVPPSSPAAATAQAPSTATREKGETTEDDDVTETDYSDEEPENPDLGPKPGFPLRPGQVVEEPMMLGAKLGIKVPAAINTYLRDYQRDGVQFLYRQYEKNLGGLLGDDMGLGKTIQIISFLSAIMWKTGQPTDQNRRKKHVSRLQDGELWTKKRKLPPANDMWPTCLIIAPSSVVHNWKREFETWGYFEVGVYTGKDRGDVLKDFKLGRLDVVLTSFDSARSDIDLLDDLPWSCIIIDEVHRVKKSNSKSTVAYHQFACTRRFGLTGTAIQNSYKELWTILDWTNPGMLGTAKQWQGYIATPLATGQSAGASEEERALALIVAHTLKDKILPNFFLRRTKEIIRDQLPRKTDQVVFCPLTSRQIQAYKNILNIPDLKNMLRSNDPCECGSRKKTKDCCHPFVPGAIFRYMSILIKLSNHLGLILPGPADTTDQIAENRKLAAFAFPGEAVPKFDATMMDAQNCGKWSTLQVLLRNWRKDKTNKVLIFTKSVKLLVMLDFHLSAKSYPFLKLEGKTKQEERMPLIDKFNFDPEVYIFLISTLAGGTGLNLTGANKVVIFDPNWNPAHDLQAMDRAFRFGQRRDVSVYRLLGAGSVEELIYARQIYKQQQMAIGYDASIQTRYFEGIQGDITKQGELFGIKNIFRLNEDKLATKLAIEKANMAELDWALANMSAPGRGKKSTKPKNELVVADVKNKDSDGLDLKGLGALLFDDEPPQTQENDIQKTLSEIGVRYSHHNDELLVPSKIEEMRTKLFVENALKQGKVRVSLKGKDLKPMKEKKEKEKRTKKKDVESKVDAAPWPPLRGRNRNKNAAAATLTASTSSTTPAGPSPVSAPKTIEKPKAKTNVALTPEQQLATRRRALVRLGFIKSAGDVSAFAKRFAQEHETAREGILELLDKWTKDNPPSDDSADEND